MISGVSDAAAQGGSLKWGETHPSAKVGGGFSAGDSNGENSIAWSGNVGPYGTVLILHEIVTSYVGGQDNRGGAVSIINAASIDRKIDDGQPDSGDVRGVGNTQGLSCGDNSDAPQAEYDESVPGDNTCSIAYIVSN